MSARLDPVIERFRFSHHNVAIMFAMGLTVNEIAKRTGFTRRRLVILLDDPTFGELIEHYRTEYRGKQHEALPTMINNVESMFAGAVRKLLDWIEDSDETGEPISIPNLIRILEAAGDRTGYSKHTSKTINMSVSYAAELDRAIERSGKSEQLKLIEGKVIPLAFESQRPRVFRRA
jgi:hypothetical protein